MRSYFLGVDPGFAMLGLCCVSIPTPGPDGEGGMAVHWMKVLESRANKGVSKTDDSIIRLSNICDQLDDILTGSPIAEPRMWDGMVVEAMSFVRNASSSTKVGMTWGALVSAARNHSLALAHMSPQKIKKAVVGRQDALKDEVQAVLDASVTYLPELVAHIPKGKRNHAYDALAASVAILKPERFI